MENGRKTNAMIVIDGSQGEGGGSFRATKPSRHTITNAEVIQRFLPGPILIKQETELVWRVSVGSN